MGKKMSIAKTKTEDLLEMIQSNPENFESRIRKGETFEDLSLHEYLYKMMEKKNSSISSVIRASFLSKSYVYQIISGERLPSRDVLIRIGYAIGCDVDEMQHLLIRGRYAGLYPKVRRDAAILCCLTENMDLTETNCFLEEMGEKGLL